MAFLTQAANRGSISTGYDIEYSNKFESDNTEGILRNYDASTGANCIANNSTTNAKKFTVSYWVKLTELLASGQNIPWVAIAGGYATVVKFQDEQFAVYDDNAGWSLKTNAKFRDTAAWYHLVCAVDTTQSTAANRVKLYVNGVVQTSFATENYGTQNADNQLWRTNTGHAVGAASYFKGGYIAELHVIDGTQYAASDFGEFDEASGIWKPKEADVTYGGQGYYLNWSDYASANSNANNTGIGKDFSGNTNPFVNLNNWSSADIATDTPTNNFSTLNTLMAEELIPVYYTVTEGGTNQVSSKAGYGCSAGTIGVSKGKWYYEVKFSSNFSYGQIGVIDTASMASVDMNLSPGQTPYGVGWFSGNGGVNVDGSYDSGAAFGQNFPSYDHNDTIGCAIDVDNNKLYFHKNGTYGNSGNPTSGATGTGAVPLSTAGDGTWHVSTNAYYGYAQTNQGGYTSMSISSAASDANGYGTFEYAPPSGYYAICTKNLAEYG